ncbi:Dedicator of cytokinesis protein 3 [Nibea albiflora]|uniref:Dedicator of cytokinesis protein 3 n=1 Tax=Nibea albiflora TaxID=240163 RepID=A0ACB7EZ18_NIBAL|nr:Dedicator of cytokinesis protein 3 [Nibea albiflora]
MDRSAEVIRQDHIQEAMRALEYLFKFIVQSRILYSRATCGMEEEQFRTSIQELFHCFNLTLVSSMYLLLLVPSDLSLLPLPSFLFQSPPILCSIPRVPFYSSWASPSTPIHHRAPSLVQAQIRPQAPASGLAASLALASPLPLASPAPRPGQVPGGGQASCTQAWSSNALRPVLRLSAALLNSFPAIFDELLQMFTVQEVAEFVRGTLGSMPSTVHIGQSMDVVKLQSIARTVDSRLFSFPESRRILLPVVLHHIHLHLRQQKELLICSGILSSIFSIIKTSSMDTSVQEEVEMMVESLLDVLLQTLLSIMSKSQSQEAGEYVSCLLSLLRQMTDIHFQHLMENFQSKEELKLSIFPRDWNIMRLLTSNIILTTAQYLSPALHKNFTEADFDFKPSLQLENLSPAKRKKVLDKYGDMRVMMTYELFSMWQNLVCFPQSLLEKIEQETWRETGISFVTSVTRLMERLLDYRDCMKGDETENKKIGCTVNLLTEWHRKEGLCRKVIHYFNKGKCWEFGIPLCRELAFQYESLYDYQSLSWIRQRLEPEFFRVGFYGRKFPFFLRNKEFVCRGHDYERLEAFQQRMLGEFPQAIAMQHPNQPDEAILQCDAQCILLQKTKSL